MTVRIVTGASFVGSTTTGASPRARESVSGSLLMATTRLAGTRRVFSITTLLVRGRERLLGVLAFFVFFFGILTSGMIYIDVGYGNGDCTL
jgi:hypothetical protein